jgi:hypothetical protein
MTVAYRSFVVRAWGRGRQTVRVLVEEIQSGRRSELRGGRAARLVAEIETLLASDSEREPAADDVPARLDT